jgi:hypothetical protein
MLLNISQVYEISLRFIQIYNGAFVSDEEIIDAVRAFFGFGMLKLDRKFRVDSLCRREGEALAGFVR